MFIYFCVDNFLLYWRNIDYGKSDTLYVGCIKIKNWLKDELTWRIILKKASDYEIKTIHYSIGISLTYLRIYNWFDGIYNQRKFSIESIYRLSLVSFMIMDLRNELFDNRLCLVIKINLLLKNKIRHLTWEPIWA